LKAVTGSLIPKPPIVENQLQTLATWLVSNTISNDLCKKSECSDVSILCGRQTGGQNFSVVT